MKNPYQSACSFVKPSPVSSLASVLAVLALCSLLDPALHAAESFHSGQGWTTVELGGGQVDRSTPGFSDNSTRFYLGFEGGVALNAHVLLGAEFSGWLIQSGNLQDSTRGSGISQVFAVARIYPQADSTFHLQLGGGSLKGWDNSPAGSSHSGSGWELGLGYDRMISTHGAITPFIRYSNGRAGNLKLSAVTVGVGFTWR
jgi:hypothetical protein